MGLHVIFFVLIGYIVTAMQFGYRAMEVKTFLLIYRLYEYVKVVDCE